MATVYLADDIKHERKDALKVLKREMAVPSTFRSGIRKIRRQLAAQTRKLRCAQPITERPAPTSSWLQGLSGNRPTPLGCEPCSPVAHGAGEVNLHN